MMISSNLTLEEIRKIITCQNCFYDFLEDDSNLNCFNITEQYTYCITCTESYLRNDMSNKVVLDLWMIFLVKYDKN